MKQSQVLIAAALAVLFLGAAGCPAQSDITPGGRCDQVGSKHTNSNGLSFTCAQVPGGNVVWQQDQPLTPDRP